MLFRSGGAPEGAAVAAVAGVPPVAAPDGMAGGVAGVPPVGDPDDVAGGVAAEAAATAAAAAAAAVWSGDGVLATWHGAPGAAPVTPAG